MQGLLSLLFLVQVIIITIIIMVMLLIMMVIIIVVVIIASKLPELKNSLSILIEIGLHVLLGKF